MPPRRRKSVEPPKNNQKKILLITLLDKFLNPNLSQIEITQNAFAIQLNLAKYLSCRHISKRKNLSKNLNTDKNQNHNNDDSDTDYENYDGKVHDKKRKKVEIFDQKAQNKFAEKAIYIVEYYLDPSNNHEETEEISPNILTIMNFIPSLLQKIDSPDQVYIQKLTKQIKSNSSSLFELQLPLLHSISEILHGPQLSNLFREKINSYIKPDSQILSSLMNICILNFEIQKNYQYQWAEIVRKTFLTSSHQQLLSSSLLLKSKRTCSNELCHMLCRVISSQNEKIDKLDFFLILILSSINSNATNKLLKRFANNNKIDELTINDCPIQVVPMNNIIDAVYAISSSRCFVKNRSQNSELSRLISEIFICSENPEILTFALYNEDESKILLESTVEAILIASQKAPQLFISNFDSIGVLYSVSKQVSHRLLKPILKLSCVYTQLFDSVLIYLRKLINHPSGIISSIDSLCSLLQYLGEQQQNQQQSLLLETETENSKKNKKRSKQSTKKKSQTTSLNFENQSDYIEMQIEVLQIIESIASTSPYLRSLVFRKLSSIVTFLSDRIRSEVKRICNKYKETSLDLDLFNNLITDSLTDESLSKSEENFVFAKEYPGSILQLLISLGDHPSDYFYFLDGRNDGFDTDFHFALQLALKADAYSVLAPYNHEAFVTFCEYLKVIDFIASEEERKIISEWCSLRLDDTFVKNVIIEEQTNDPLLLYTIIRQLTTYSLINSEKGGDKEELISISRKLFAQTSECDFGVTKIKLKNHLLECDILPEEAFEDDIKQFSEELTCLIAETAVLDEEGHSEFEPSFFIDEMKEVVIQNAITGRHCQAFLDIFEKLLPVNSDSSSKLLDLLSTLCFDDLKTFSRIIDLLLSKSPPADAFNCSNILISCIKNENKTVLIRKESFKNTVLNRIARFLASLVQNYDDFDQDEFQLMMSLIENLLSVDHLIQVNCFIVFKCLNFVIKKFSDNLNRIKNDKEEIPDQSNFTSFDEFSKLKEMFENWISVHKQKLGIRKIGICKAYLQMTENHFKKIYGSKDDDDNDDEEEEDFDGNMNRMHDYGAEFDSLLESLQKGEIDKDKNENDDVDDFINLEDLMKNDRNEDSDDSKKKKKKKAKKKRMPHFVTRKWRSNSKWIDDGLKEVTDSDDNFADLEDFVVESSPPQSSCDEEEEDQKNM